MVTYIRVVQRGQRGLTAPDPIRLDIIDQRVARESVRCGGCLPMGSADQQVQRALGNELTTGGGGSQDRGGVGAGLELDDELVISDLVAGSGGKFAACP